MSDANSVARAYLSTPAGAFWKWTDDGKVVAWTHGATIAFREELSAVAERLGRSGLPDWDGILLVIAATREYWSSDSEAFKEHVRQGAPDLETQAVLELLDGIRELPAEHLRDPQSKAELVEIIFEGVEPPLTGAAADVVRAILSTGMTPNLLQIPSLARLRGGRVQTSRTLRHLLSQMKRGLEGLTALRLDLRRRTGLDDLPESADLVGPTTPVHVRGLLDQLAWDPELGGLCRVARNLSAVISVPRVLQQADELPLGGVSDIANHGTLDRLLLSELAQDDLMLAARIALKEALYLRREAPPHPPPQRRAVLVDVGLRMWGLPRLYATAALLSLASSSRDVSEVEAMTGRGDRLVPIDLSAREGLIRHLESLAPELHVGAALGPFFDRLSESTEAAEAIVITARETLSDPEFLQVLRDQPPCFVAAVDRQGGFEFVARGVRGARVLTRLQLNLESLLNPQVTKIEPVRNDADLPSLLLLDRLPFRLPYVPNEKQGKEACWSIRRGPVPPGEKSPPPGHLVFVITRDQRLILFDNWERGAREIASGVPQGACLWYGATDDRTEVFCLIGRQDLGEVHLLRIHLGTSRLVAQRKLKERAAPAVRVQGAAAAFGVGFVISTAHVEAFSLAEGHLLGDFAIPGGVTWKGGRFFQSIHPGETRWFALGFDGRSISLNPVPVRGAAQVGFPLRLFDRVGKDGPFAILPKGSVANLALGTEWEWTNIPAPAPRVLDLSPDGSRILIEQSPEPLPSWGAGARPARERRLLELDLPLVSGIPQHVETLPALDLTAFRLGTTLIHRLTEIHSNGHSLFLTTRTGVHRKLELRNRRLGLDAVAKFSRESVATARFEVVRHPSLGSSLWQARWRDGSCAWVESRGLLHLRSSDPTLPEFSLVLDESHVSVWLNTGLRCAAPYYQDESMTDTLTPEEFLSQVLTPFLARLA